jgi:hypothetical protein
MLRRILAWLRLFFGALFVLAVPAVVLGSVDAVAGEGTVDRLGSGLAWLVVLSFLVGLYGALRLFNRSEDHDLFGNPRPEAQVRRLRELGVLVESECRVRRAFEVESDTNGSQYVCELDDGSCLLLRGQFLWDYEHSWSWRGLRRRFPCTRFVLQEVAGSRGVAGLVCLGEPLEPESVAPGFTGDEALDQELFEGEVTRSTRPYEELRHVLLHERPLRSSDP